MLDLKGMNGLVLMNKSVQMDTVCMVRSSIWFEVVGSNPLAEHFASNSLEFDSGSYWQAV